MMRNVFSPIVIVFCLLTLVACGSNKVEGKGPEDIPVEWVNAEVQKDGSKMLDLLKEKTNALNSDQKAENNTVIESYKLTEWKASEDRYFYEVIYENPQTSGATTEQMEVVKTKEGWKRTSYSDLRNFDTLTQDLEPNVLKEMHD
ncbi:lipoprotein (plasmid) [Rossellomorea sp. FS2]|uniref:LptM family lipoprotein n=1 Tax=Rossellomorea sp. FS2 TaxID=3391447 RepID=UPI003A4DB36A